MDYARLGRLNATELRSMQDRALATVIGELVWPHHRYYRQLMEEAGLGPSDLATTDDLVRLPFTDRHTVWQRSREAGDPQLFCLKLPWTPTQASRGGGLLSALGRKPRTAQADPSRPLRVFFAGGRTTPPTPIFYCQHDLDRLNETGRRIFQVAGVDGDRPLINALPYGPNVAFWQVAAATLDQGITAVQTGGSKVMDVAKTLTALTNTAAATLAGFPGFLSFLLEAAAAERLSLDCLERLLAGGEPLSPGMRERLRDGLAAVGARTDSGAVVGLYLNTEARAGWAECVGGSGYHTYPDMEFLEVVDPATGERVGPGETGELVISHLDWRGTFLLRYRTGDIVEGGLCFDPCPHCGRTVPRLATLVYPAAERLHDGTSLASLRVALDAAADVHLWQLTVQGADVDLAVSPRPGAGDDLHAKLSGLVRLHLGKEPRRLQVVSSHELYRRLGTDREAREARIVFST